MLSPGHQNCQLVLYHPRNIRTNECEYWYYFHFLCQGFKFASNCQYGYGSRMCDKHWYSISSVYQYDKGRKTDQNLKTFTFRIKLHHEQLISNALPELPKIWENHVIFFSRSFCMVCTVFISSETEELILTTFWYISK